MDLIKIIGDYNEYIIIGLLSIIIIFLLLLVILFIKTRKLKNKYNQFLSGSDGKTLEDEINKRFIEIEGLKKDITSLNKKTEKINENLMITYQKIGIVKYDAFKEMGGKLSFVLTLLNKENKGFILNSVHSSREGCYTYFKEIINGESFVELSNEEKKSLNMAKNQDIYDN